MRARAWAGVLLAPTGLLLGQMVAYALVTRACLHDAPWYLHLTMGGALALVVAGIGLSRSAEIRDHDSSTLMLGRLGVISGGLFLVALLGQWLAVLLLSPCQ